MRHLYSWSSAIIMQAIAIINSSINPVIYSVFNKLIREQTLQMLGCSNTSVRTVPLTSRAKHLQVHPSTKEQGTAQNGNKNVQKEAFVPA